MDFKQLESFVAAVNEGSFSNAADRLQLSQSMVTIHVRNLEKELGTRLLNRTTRSMELSQDGRVFYDYARRMLELNRDSILALSRADQDVNTIRIVSTRFISRYYIVDWIIDFTRRYPHINFQFETSYNAEMSAKLEKDGCEFAFSNMKLMKSDYTVKHCGTANLVVITPNDARFRSFLGKPFPLKLFGEEPMITRSSTSSLQQEFMRWMKASIPNTRLKVAAAINDTETIKQMVAAGVGISVISLVAVREYVDEGKLLSFPIEGTMPYHLYFAYKKKYLSREQTLFRDYVLEQVAQTERNASDDPSRDE